ncbi:MAG: hypothetical protein WCV90_03455 [Candidatus Woesearchaeota archaeon]|jgi:hypothetical protein
MIKNVCELCDESLVGAEEDTINYCHKCQEQKEREDDVKNITNVGFSRLKQKMR